MESSTSLSWNTRLEQECLGNSSIRKESVILTHYDSISHELMDKLTQFGYPFVLVVEDMKEALRLHDMDFPVILGSLDEEETCKMLPSGMQPCLLRLTTTSGRQHSLPGPRHFSFLPIVTTCSNDASEDILIWRARPRYQVRSADGSFFPGGFVSPTISPSHR